jgi:hypothetical protein
MGSLTRALSHWQAGAALPPLEVDESSRDAEGDGDGRIGSLKSNSDDGQRAWLKQWVILPRIETVSLASYMMALLYHQSLDFEAALPYLRRFSGSAVPPQPSNLAAGQCSIRRWFSHCSTCFIEEVARSVRRGSSTTL